MTDVALARPSAAAAPLPWPTILLLTAAMAAAVGVLAGHVAAPRTEAMEWQLALLLRFMAAVKAALALGALGLAHWRLRQPVTDRLALGYVVASAAMAVAPGLIWARVALVPAAGAFHAGLLLYLVLAWRDGAVGLPASRHR